ncbi:endonuclease/exonuclease/phosphatase family protein [Lusitaniella coriacea LEGE 07157]|uniref:Endonuclease/exonuclease/phosphatase family protein n=1 Tax=Lusitaniella coriacea LEGE 07157 TaxID=945747 RepID=A0A8J7JEX8_9CYAN|nr:endonuclease/exonuclease/phosphatase family protein [Lusitaniella coriacea]MBE9118990.1 endonuclease/exonuclease/phosphatase family protein [Lusitaniella coriacea LEGE 07157]
MIKVITINILFELDEWERRRELLVEGLKAEKPDLIGLQEVQLPEDTSAWLAERLEMPYVQLVPYQNNEIPGIPDYGAAMLSRYPFIQQDILDLHSQGRFAQRVRVEINGQSITFCNGHYYWYPGESPERVKQIQRLRDWLGELPPEMPIVAVGDFNGTPETRAIAHMKENYTSAYASHWGKEPEYTCPTPLSRRGWRRWLRQIILNWKANKTLKPWRGTLDYIFISSHWQVRDCRLILTQPAPFDRTLYPSDHFGLVADLAIAPEP